MSLYIVDIHGEIEGDYEIVRKYEEQEPFMATPCISSKVCEHDRIVTLDKIRAEIETKYGQCKLTEYIVQYDGMCTGTKKIGDIADILQILDKYKAESEGKE